MTNPALEKRTPRPPLNKAAACFYALCSVAGMTWLIQAVRADSSLANVPILYLLVVTICALVLGRLAAIVASIAAFFSFDLFFTNPKLQFSVSDPAEWLALGMFLVTSVVIGQLTALLKLRAFEAERLQIETRALAEASWAVASEPDLQRAFNTLLSQLSSVINLESAALSIAEDETSYRVAASFGSPLPQVPITLDLWDKALDSANSSSGCYLPILLEGRPLGVLYFKLKEQHVFSDSERQVIRSLTNHAAVILQRDKLMQSQAKAQALIEADKLKTALLHMVSHDFRSPLTSIKASVCALAEEGAPIDAECQRGLLAAIDQETDRLNRIVGSILDFSRLEAGAWQPRTEAISLDEVISAALTSFPKDEQIKVKRDLNVTDILADDVQVVQVLRNLIENAVKFSAPGSPIELRISEKGDSAIIEILDRGPGLPEGKEANIFEPFQRGPRLSESSTPGLGMGLAICKGLVEANKGVITAANRDGGGSIFRITLPIATRSVIK